MERGSGRPPFFDGTNYPYWKIRKSVHLQNISSWVWEICEDTDYMVLAARIDQEQMDQHEANSKSRNAIFLTCRFLSLIEFLTSLRLERSARPLKGIMRGLPRSRLDSLRCESLCNH